MTQYVHAIKQLFGLRTNGGRCMPKASPRDSCPKGLTGYAVLPKTHYLLTTNLLPGEAYKGFASLSLGAYQYPHFLVEYLGVVQ